MRTKRDARVVAVVRMYLLGLCWVAAEPEKGGDCDDIVLVGIVGGFCFCRLLLWLDNLRFVLVTTLMH